MEKSRSQWTKLGDKVNASKDFRDRYRWHAGVEATISRFKHRMGTAKLRIRGMVKVTYTAMLRALGLNIRRVAGG